MNNLFKLTGLSLASLLVGCAAVYPFLQADPRADARQLADWQMPSKLAALESADQMKLLARLTYPDLMPKLNPVPDFASIKDTDTRKKAFFEYLTPFIERENARIEKLRPQIEELRAKLTAGQQLTVEEYAFVYSLFDEYRIDMLDADVEGLNELLVRVDVLPVSLVLTQAAKESGWGSSRFAVEGYNFFGQWCFKAGCGVVPSRRGAGRYHEVAVFTDAAASVNAYFYNLNTFYTYEELRRIRAQLRQADGAVAAHKLAAGLVRYSERGQQYVEEITAMIHSTTKLLGAS
jgi:Bax protein